MASTDAKPVPRKNEPYRLGFCMRLDTALTNVFKTSWVAPAAYVSLDGSGFCGGNDSLYFSGPPVEIDSVGIGYVDITASGMNADLVLVRVCDDSGVALSSQCNFFTALYPEEAGDYRVNMVQVNGLDIVDDGVVDSNLTTISETASGDIAGAVWTAIQNDYDHVSGSFGDYLDEELSKTATSSELTFTESAIKNDIAAMSGSILDANLVQVSGVGITLADLQSADVSTSGFATRSQLEYWGLVILNNCGGGPVG